MVIRPSWAWFCCRFLSVKMESFLSTVTNVQLGLGDCDKMKIHHGLFRCITFSNWAFLMYCMWMFFVQCPELTFVINWRSINKLNWVDVTMRDEITDVKHMLGVQMWLAVSGHLMDARQGQWHYVVEVSWNVKIVSRLIKLTCGTQTPVLVLVCTVNRFYAETITPLRQIEIKHTTKQKQFMKDCLRLTSFHPCVQSLHRFSNRLWLVCSWSLIYSMNWTWKQHLVS